MTSLATQLTSRKGKKKLIYSSINRFLKKICFFQKVSEIETRLKRKKAIQVHSDIGRTQLKNVRIFIFEYLKKISHLYYQKTKILSTEER